MEREKASSTNAAALTDRQTRNDLKHVLLVHKVAAEDNMAMRF